MTKRTANLRKRRVELVGELRKFHDGIGEEQAYTPEQREEFDRRSAEITEVDGDIERSERLEDIERARGEALAREEASGNVLVRQRDRRLGPPGHVVSLALQGWMRSRASSGDLDVTPEHQEAMRQCGFRPGRNQVELSLLSPSEARACFMAHQRGELRMTTAATEGAELIPEDFVPSIEIALLATSRIRAFATVLRTLTGAALPWPTIDDTGNDADVPGEGAAATVTDVVTGNITFNAYTSASIVKVSIELMQDTPLNMTQVLGELLGKRIGRYQNGDFTTGDGAGNANGIVTAATQAFVSSSKVALVNDEVVKMPFQVDPEYQSGPGVAWMMHNFFAQECRLLKDSNNRYLWLDGLERGQPSSLMGYPVCINQGMASAHAGSAKVIIFGDISKYLIRDVGTVVIKHLVERYANELNEAFVGYMRSDGDLLDAGTNPVKYLEQAV